MTDKYIVKVFELIDGADSAAWRDWLNVRPADVELLPSMAAHQYMRFRGGMRPDEKPITIIVYHAPADVERQDNDEPLNCIKTTFVVAASAPRFA